MKLIEIKPAKVEGKKWTAIFDNNGRTKSVSFGAAGMDDYTLTKNSAQRDRYRQRHAKDLKSNDPTRPGYLSYYILWGDSPSMAENIRNYKRKFNL